MWFRVLYCFLSILKVWWKLWWCIVVLWGWRKGILWIGRSIIRGLNFLIWRWRGRFLRLWSIGDCRMFWIRWRSMGFCWLKGECCLVFWLRVFLVGLCGVCWMMLLWVVLVWVCFRLVLLVGRMEGLLVCLKDMF